MSAVSDARRHLVLLDLVMPRMSGMELLRQVRADPALKSMLVLVLTSSTDERDKDEAYRLNVAGYLLIALHARSTPPSSPSLPPSLRWNR
ncbi:response regulator [Sorangium sp. So ce1153]|uniref:response regulator n=1 Tax=Sorangium sp. So ce1153 TaxID=3133333 RepID=UPI003F5FCD1D